MYYRSIAKLSLLLIVAFSLGAVIAFWRAIQAPSTGNQAVLFNVNVGDGPRLIATNLKAQALLDNERPFYIYVLLTGRRHRFYPGNYQIKPSISLKQLVDLMTSGKVDQSAVRIIEGWRLNDIANEVAKKTKMTAAEFKAAAPINQYEGYLFPDTYFFTAETSATQAVKIMRDNFDRRTKGLTLSRDDVILASIIEREAKRDADRPKIASVYLNRLKARMPLEADPTVQYAKGDWMPLAPGDSKSVIAIYNTYLNPGLPPGPIANPGLKSLRAAKQPEGNDYYYFFNLPDGSTIYSRTLEEHNANRRQYQLTAPSKPGS